MTSAKNGVGLNAQPTLKNNLKNNKVEINFICKKCTEALPDIRNLLEISKHQKKLQDDVDQHDTRITRSEFDVEALKEKLAIKDTQLEQMNNRLATLEAKMMGTEEVETIAQRCFNSADFPPITQVREDQRATDIKIEAVIKSQQEAKDETKRREDTKNSLIVYGIPEKEDSKSNQMKSDFGTIKQLYEARVPISSNDLLQVSRIGQIKTDQIRPIKITFANMEKRLEVLRNNKSLILYGEEHKCELEFCTDDEDHKHIYITTDKTKQQREEEKVLRQELKRRKVTEQDLIIRNGKIVKKAVNHARWSEVAQDV